MSFEGTAGTMEAAPSNMSPTDHTAIKYESPYSTNPPPPQYDPQASLKRRFSYHDESGEKRQRVEVPAPDDDFDIDAIAAQAAQAAADEFTSNIANDPPMQSHIDHTDNGYSAEHEAGLNSGFFTDPHLYMRILTLPVLESFSTQILSTLAQGPYEETIRIITQPESDLGQAYVTLKSLFDQTKKIYSQNNLFLSADELKIHEPEHRLTIRTTNLATFVSSVFGGQDVGFWELDGHFIDTFVPESGELSKDPGMLYLDLKTQMYLAAVSQEEQEKTKDEILEDLFPDSLPQTVQARHPDFPLTPTEVEFCDVAKARRDFLQNDAGDADSISALSEKYTWEDFLRSLSSHLKETYASLIAPYMSRHRLSAPPPPAPLETNSVDSLDNENALEDDQDLALDIEQATQAATQHALQSIGYGGYDDAQQGAEHSHREQLNHPNGLSNVYSQQYPVGAVPYHTQTAPTQVLYEQARQAAVAKASPHSRRPGLPSQRRPWSTEEENALMAGLDQVKGPHWSQILALYGPKGQVSEILKDRNQVQLKDKARNLKLFFLKSNIEVPYYLQCVTGELKTRAPSQAARKEAEERARAASDEEQARFHSIMTLAGGMQAPPQHFTETHDHQSHDSLSHDRLSHDGMSHVERDSSHEELQVEEVALKIEPHQHESLADVTLGARLQESINEDGSRNAAAVAI